MQHLYIGTYTTIDHPVTGKSRGIYHYALDDETGNLHHYGYTDGIINPSFLAVSPDKRFLYAVSEVDNYEGAPAGAVYAYAIDKAKGTLTLLNRRSTEGKHPCHVTVDADGKAVIAANYSSGSVISFPLKSDGSLDEYASLMQHEGAGADMERQKGPHAHSVWLHPNNRFVYALDLGGDMIALYQIGDDSALTPLDPPYISTAPGAGPRHLAWHPNGAVAYVINELDNSIAAYNVDAQAGAMEQFDYVPTLPVGSEGQSITADIHVHPNGRFLYGTNRGHDSLVQFDIASDGTLSYAGTISTNGNHPRNFAIDPTGKWLLVANQNSSTVVRFRIDPQTGTPSSPKSYPVPAPVCLRFVWSAV